MTIDNLRRPFNFSRWIDEHAHLLKPPVGNKLVFENAGMVVQVVGGPNRRVDFHDDPVEEFFYQLKGDMILKLAEAGKIHDVRINQGEVFLLPARMRGIHRSDRCRARSVWWWKVDDGRTISTPSSGSASVAAIACTGSRSRWRTSSTTCRRCFRHSMTTGGRVPCARCGEVHPGKEPPSGWAEL